MKHQLYDTVRQTAEAPPSMISQMTVTVSFATATALLKYKTLIRKRVVQEHPQDASCNFYLGVAKVIGEGQEDPLPFLNILR